MRSAAGAAVQQSRQARCLTLTGRPRALCVAGGQQTVCSLHTTVFEDAAASFGPGRGRRSAFAIIPATISTSPCFAIPGDGRCSVAQERPASRRLRAGRRLGAAEHQERQTREHEVDAEQQPQDP